MLEIKNLTVDHWEPVRSIYLDGIATGHATFETGPPEWDQWNASHLPAPRLIAMQRESVIGWAALNPVSTRAVYVGVAEVSIYIDKVFRGQGSGLALLRRLVAEAETNGIWTLQASVFPENEASVRLHASCGFSVVGTRERIAKLDGVWRDTLLLERRSMRAGLA